MKRNAARAATIVITSLLLCSAAGTAQGATAAFDGDALVVTSDEASELQFRLSDDGTQDVVLVNTGFTSHPAECTNDLAFNNPPREIRCPGRNNLRLNAGPGGNSVTFNSSSSINSTIPSCFESYAINLGDGDNELRLPLTCPVASSSMSVIAGSGNDTFYGGIQGPVTYSSGGGIDRIHGSPFGDVIDGGDGDDVLFGEGGNDQVLGRDGSDALNGRAGNDLIDGGAGDDELGYCRGCADSNDTSVGADTYIGGPGTDKLWFDNRPAGVTISLDGAANDGTDGEGDNIGADVEKILATVYADSYTGSAGADHFEGNGGTDTIRGAGGNDELHGDDENDQIFGDAGDDRLYGGSDDDVVEGGAGADSLYGDFTNACSPYACAAGNDQLRARDGEVDLVNCGTGADTAQLDSGDLLDEDPNQLCETVDRGEAPPPQDPDPDPGPDITKPSLSALLFSPARFRAASSGGSVGTRAGTTISYAVSEAATIRFRVERVLPGRQVGGRCVKPTQSNRSARRCSRYKLMPGSFEQRASAGANTFKFTGRLRGSKLRPGKYRLRGAATDAAGNASSLRRTAFRIVRS